MTTPPDPALPAALRQKHPIRNILIILAVIIVGAFLRSTWQSTASHDIKGTFALTDSGKFTTGQICQGSGGYDDIQAGAQITVKDGSGKTLATGELVSGVADDADTCTFPFVVTGVPGADFYAISVSHRGEITFSRSQMTSNGWSVGLTLGS
jgi:hypothetical protein